MQPESAWRRPESLPKLCDRSHILLCMKRLNWPKQDGLLSTATQSGHGKKESNISALRTARAAAVRAPVQQPQRHHTAHWRAQHTRADRRECRSSQRSPQLWLMLLNSSELSQVQDRCLSVAFTCVSECAVQHGAPVAVVLQTRTS